MDIRTGPLRPEEAFLIGIIEESGEISYIRHEICFLRYMFEDCFRFSYSVEDPLSISFLSTSMCMTRRGTSLLKASMQPDTILPSPGPAVTMNTPGFPDVRAYPSAMKIRLDSCRPVIILMFF